jgi:uncharacterized protein involved in exopolysaccharide biosynthesis
LEAARKEVEELQARLAQEKPTVMLWKSPPTTALFLAEAAGTPPKAPEGGTDQRKGYYEETTNETYLYVQQQLADKQASLKGLEERERSLRESGEGTKKEMTALQEEAARYNYESKVLKRQADAFTRGYDLVADKVRQAQIAESEQEDLVDLKLVANAVQSDKKVAPKRSAIVFSAAALGFAIAAFAAVVRHRLEARLP